jgi:2-oxoglutarate dehydrogenase E2 component (dihydrolipoamide succinyltransferase)
MPTPDSVEIRAPSGQEEGTRSQVLRWLKAVGEPVAEHEPLIELETDKVTVEVASPGAGVLTEILKQEQEEVAPGEILGRIGPAAAAPVDAPRESGAAASRHASVGSAAPAMHARATRSAASGAAAPGSSGAAAPGSSGAAAPGSSGAAAPGSSGAAAAASNMAGGAAARQLSPAVRRLLAEHSLAPASIRGTGEGGRITVADVMREVANVAEARGNSNDVESTPSHRVPHSAVRKRIAARMVESLLHTAPHVTTVFEVDMGQVLAHRQRHREEFARQGVTLTLTAYFAQAAVAAIRAVPEANSRWTEAALEIYDTINLGVATAAEGGLVVPVLHHLESLDLLETARRLEALVGRARDGALTQADVRGGTFTLSNHGVSGSLLAAPIIIPQPQSAILGLGKLEKRAVVIERDGEDAIVVRSCCYATLTIDHRVLDGSRANQFLQAFTERLCGWKD